MDKKGFTLIELIVTFILLAVVGSIIVISVSSSFESSKDKEYKKFVDRVISASSVYVELNRNVIDDLYNNKKNVSIDVELLINEGLLDETLVNPYTGEKIGKNDKVIIGLDDKSGLLEYFYKTNDDYLNDIAESKDGVFITFKNIETSFESLKNSINEGGNYTINSYEDLENYYKNLGDYGGYILSLYDANSSYISDYRKYNLNVDSIEPKINGTGTYKITYSWINSLGVRKVAKRSIIIEPQKCSFKIRVLNVKVGDVSYPEYKKEFIVNENEKVKLIIPEFNVVGYNYSGLILKTPNGEKYITKEDLSKELIFTCSDQEAYLSCDGIDCNDISKVCKTETPGDACSEGELVLKRKLFDIDIEIKNPEYGSVSKTKLERIPYGTVISVKDKKLSLTYDNKVVEFVDATTIPDEQKFIYVFNGYSPSVGIITDNLKITASFEKRSREYAADKYCDTQTCTWDCRTEHGNRIENDKWYCVDGCGNEVGGPVGSFDANRYQGRTEKHDVNCRPVCPRGGTPTSNYRCVF